MLLVYPHPPLRGTFPQGKALWRINYGIHHQFPC